MSKKLSHEEASKLMRSANLQPLEQYSGADKPWRCRCLKCDRVVTPRYASVRNGKNGCAYCAGNKVDKEAAIAVMRAHGFEPQVPYPGTDAGWLSKCTTCGRESSPRFHGVSGRSSKCKFCSGNAVVPSEAVTKFVENSLQPLVDFPGASKQWKSKCMKCGVIVKPRLSDINQGHSGCTNCAAKKRGESSRLDASAESLERVMIDMANAKLKPLEPFKLSRSKWKCECLVCGAIVFPNYSSIKSGYGGCMPCFRKKQDGLGRLEHDSAARVMLARKLEPLVQYPGANKPWKCKCLDCGNLVQPHYAHVQQGRKGCSFCAAKNQGDKTRRPQDDVFRIARESGWEPLEPYNSRHKPWKCKCLKCGKTSNAYLASMLAGFGCKHCSGLIVNPLEAEKLMLKSNLKPLVPYPGSGVPWKCLCLKCNNEVFPRYSTVRVRIGGCKYCATHGFDFSKGGILYVITNELLGAHKIGITNEAAKEKRLKKHEAEGWLTYKTAFFENGNDAFEIEQQVLTWWRTELGLPMYLSGSEMPQGGHTETVDSNEIDLMEIWTQIEALTKKLKEEGSKSSVLKTTMPKRQKTK